MCKNLLRAYIYVSILKEGDINTLRGAVTLLGGLLGGSKYNNFWDELAAKLIPFLLGV